MSLFLWSVSESGPKVPLQLMGHLPNSPGELQVGSCSTDHVSMGSGTQEASQPGFGVIRSTEIILF